MGYLEYKQSELNYQFAYLCIFTLLIDLALLYFQTIFLHSGHI